MVRVELVLREPVAQPGPAGEHPPLGPAALWVVLDAAPVGVAKLAEHVAGALRAHAPRPRLELPCGQSERGRWGGGSARFRGIAGREAYDLGFGSGGGRGGRMLELPLVKEGGPYCIAAECGAPFLGHLAAKS